MEWQQLEYFKVTARFQHMTLAAEELKLSQPALSRAISRLEAELGVPLFDRQGRSIVLNKYGKLFLSHVNRILYEFEESKREIEDIISPDSGEVSLGFLHTLGASSIPELIKGFSRKYPEIRFTLHQNNTEVLINQLFSGEIGLCMSYPDESLEGVNWTRLWSEELYVIVPSDHRLAGCSTIDLKEIEDERLISYKEGYGTRKIIDEFLKKAGISPKITFESDEVHTVIGFVAAGLGIGMIPDSGGIYPKEISVLHVNSPECRRDIGIACLKGRYMPPPELRFLEYVKEHFEQNETI